MPNQTERLFFAYRLRHSSSCELRFNIRALGNGDGNPNLRGRVLSSGEMIEWRYPMEFVSTKETWEERQQGRLRDLAFGFSECEFNAAVAADELLISQSTENRTEFRRHVAGTFSSTSIVHLAPLQHAILWERIDQEKRNQDEIFHYASELMTSDRLIRVAETSEILAGDYLTISVGANGPAACLAIRAMLPDRNFEGELFSTFEVPLGEHEFYSEEAGKISGITTKISACIGHFEACVTTSVL